MIHPTAALGQLSDNSGRQGVGGLIRLLVLSDDPQLQLDVLKGLTEAYKGHRQLSMPSGWGEVEGRLGSSPNQEVQSLTELLSLTFGSQRALETVKKKVRDPAVSPAVRKTSLEALLTARDPGLPDLLIHLLQDRDLRAAALRGLGSYDYSPTPRAILGVYPLLTPGEKRDALNSLASRVPFALALLQAVGSTAIPPGDISPDVLRQLRNLKHSEVSELLQKTWGVARESPADKRKEIERYKALYWAGGSQPGEASRGRAVFARICQQCHVLFDTGGNVGPELTGSNRADLDYILQNMADPNAVIPNEYRSSTLETKDERILTGIVKKQDGQSVTIVTANETLVLPRTEIKTLQQTDVSMMPEGLLAQLTDQEVRDLVYYLTRPGQVPLPAQSAK